MEIEKTAPPNYFRNIQHKGIVNILYSAGWLLDHIKDILDPFDLTPQQYNVMRIIESSSQPISIHDIRERMLDKMSDISRIVERLVIKDLVRKEISLKDKRNVDICLTEKGVELLSQLSVKSSAMDNLIMQLSDTELEELNILLDKMRMKSKAIR